MSETVTHSLTVLSSFAEEPDIEGLVDSISVTFDPEDAESITEASSKVSAFFISLAARFVEGAKQAAKELSGE